MTVAWAAEGVALLAEGKTFDDVMPSVEDAFFHDPGHLFGIEALEISSIKAMVILGLGVLVAILFMVGAARKAAVVPGRLAFAGESLYGLVRNGIARDVIGPKEAGKFVPVLATLFIFILLQNVWGIIPFAQHAPTGQFTVPLFLAVLVWLVYVGAGIKHHGFFGYFKSAVYIPGVPPAMHLLLVPIEFLSNIILRPATLAIRLFANMFAGHMLVVVAATGTVFLVTAGGLDTALSVLPFIGSIALVFFELMIAALQAYVFTILTAVYIQTSISDEH